MITRPALGLVVAFDDFEADMRTRELRHRGTPIRLPDQSFQVLSMLLERPGELITREDLRTRLWPADTFVDFDHGLNNAVNRLRDALQDSAATPRFIQTLPRRGYRFIGHIRSDTPVRSVSVTSTTSHNWRFWIVAIASIAALASALWFGRKWVAKPATQTLVVLPMENLSGDPSQQYLADGITDTLTTDLARVHALNVISRRSAEYYRASKEPLKTIAEKLGADLVIEGSIVRSGNRIRVAAQLIDARTDRHIWAQNYERAIDDVLQLQSELALAIASQVAVQVTPQEAATLKSVGRINREAYDHYLHARFLLDQRKADSYEQALAEFESAVRIAPDMPLAHVGIAQVNNLMGFSMGGALPRDVAAKRAIEAANKALALDPDCAEAHAELAFTTSRYGKDRKLAEREFIRAIELKPNEPVFHHWYGIYLKVQGRLQEAAAQYEEALRFDPMSPNIRRANGMLLLAMGKRDEAIAELQRAVQLGPTQFNVRISLGYAYLKAGRLVEAIAENQKAVELSHRNAGALARLAQSYAASGDLNSANQILLEMKEKKFCPYYIAFVHAVLSQKQETLYYLEQAAGDQICGIEEAQTEEVFDLVRSDSRFATLVSNSAK